MKFSNSFIFMNSKFSHQRFHEERNKSFLWKSSLPEHQNILPCQTKDLSPSSLLPQGDLLKAHQLRLSVGHVSSSFPLLSSFLAIFTSIPWRKQGSHSVIPNADWHIMEWNLMAFLTGDVNVIMIIIDDDDYSFLKRSLPGVLPTLRSCRVPSRLLMQSTMSPRVACHPGFSCSR